MANLRLTKNGRYKLAFILKPDEFLRDGVERLVDEEIARKEIIVPPMPIEK